VVNAAAGPSGPIACLTAVPAFAASRKARPAPVSKRFMLKDRFLRALRGFLLATMDRLIPGAVFKLVQWLHSKTLYYDHNTHNKKQWLFSFGPLFSYSLYNEQLLCLRSLPWLYFDNYSCFRTMFAEYSAFW